MQMVFAFAAAMRNIGIILGSVKIKGSDELIFSNYK